MVLNLEKRVLLVRQSVSGAAKWDIFRAECTTKERAFQATWSASEDESEMSDTEEHALMAAAEELQEETPDIKATVGEKIEVPLNNLNTDEKSDDSDVDSFSENEEELLETIEEITAEFAEFKVRYLDLK